MLGRLLGNRYEIVEKIGSGGMADVYRAKCHLLDRFVAVKILKDEFTTDSDFKVMQITDVHLGGGFLSYSEDRMALNAIAAMIGYEKPDLVVFTGDQAFAVPYIAGTFKIGRASCRERV